MLNREATVDFEKPYVFTPKHGSFIITENPDPLSITWGKRRYWVNAKEGARFYYLPWQHREKTTFTIRSERPYSNRFKIRH